MIVERAGANPEWRTPRRLFELLDKHFGPFTLDAAATKENALCPLFYTKEQSGLENPWTGRVFCNPPYGGQIGNWVKRACGEVGWFNRAERAVLLLPARTDTAWFHQFVMGYAREVLLMKGRIPFEGGAPGGSPLFPSLVAVYGRPSDGATSVRPWRWKLELQCK